MLLPTPKTAASKSRLKKLLDFAEPIHQFVRGLFLSRGSNRRRYEPRRRAEPGLCLTPIFQELECRALLSITAGNTSYNASTAAPLVVSAPGLLADCTDTGGYQMTAHEGSGPSDGTLTVNGDGSFTYTPNTGYQGYDSFTYYASDTNGGHSNYANVQITVELGAVSFTNSTKLAVDTIGVGQPILNDTWGQSITSPLPAGGSGGTVISPAPMDGAPATAHNLSLEYNSVAGSPDQVLEGDVQFAMSGGGIPSTIQVSATFDGQAAGTSYITTQGLGANPTVHVAMQVSTSSLPTGYYPYTLTLSGSSMYGTATISGYAAVVNNSASPFGMGWDMPGLDHAFQNNVSGVPAGVLLTDGTGQGWYFTQGSGNSYASPPGPYAFDTLTSVTGGGWQLVDKFGTTFNFNSSGDLTSRVERTGETTTYTWNSGHLADITDAFNRSVVLAYTGGLLTSIQDYAASTWSFGYSGSDLTSVTEPNPGSGAPVWQYAYSGGYLSSVEDPDTNTTTYTLNSNHRLSSTSLPGGSHTSDTSEQNYGYGSSMQYNPAAATLASSVIPSSTSPNGYASDYQTDPFGNPTSETDPYGNVTTIQRDVNGLPTQITLPPPATGDASPVTTITHDSMGNETLASGAQPTYGTWTFNSFGEWATFTDSSGKQWTRTFDAHGNVLTEADPSGSQISWTYDSYGRPLTMTVPAPNSGTGTETTQFVYDSDERLTKIIWPDNSTRLFGFNADDRQTSFTDENSHQTTTAFDVLGRITSVTNAASGVTSTTYDKDGNELSVTDPMNNVTSYQYNARNELTQETLPAPAQNQSSPVLSFSYDADGNKLSYTDALNRQTTYTWDKLDRMASETLPIPAQGQSGPKTTYAYDNLSRKVSEANALSGTTTWAYGNTDISQLTSETLPPPSGSGSGPTTSYGYDVDGRQNTVTDAMNHTTTTTFTVNGQVASVKDNLSNTTTYGYGNGGELLTTTDPLTHTTTNDYDSRYRLMQTTDANSGVTQYTLDAAGNRTKLVDPDNNATTWVFDALNRPTSETNAQGTTTTTYNADSEVTSIQDADGRVRDFAYNFDNELTAENWMSGNTVVATMSYGYDLGGELTSASDPNSAYAFSYDGDGNVLTTDNNGTPNVPHVVLTSSYDAMGDMLTQSATIAGTADFLNSYSYDGDQNLTMVQQQQQTGGNTVAPKEVDSVYNALGQTTGVWAYNTLSGPRTDVYHGASTYDAANRLTALAYTSNGGANTIDTFGLTYDAASNVATFSSIDGTATYGYDPTNQVTSASYSTNTGGHQPANENYSFTANGNRNMTGYSTGSGNLMSSDGTYNYSYDADGNRLTRTQISSTYSTDYKTTFTWDYRNRLTDVDNYDNNGLLKQHVHYVYDVLDHLIATEVDPTGGGTYTQISHDVLDVSPEIPDADVPGVVTAQPVLQFDGSGNLSTRYLEALDRIFAQGAVSSLTSPDTVTSDLVDKLRSVRDIVDNSGNLVDHVVYDSFGQVAYESAPSVAHFAGFAGGHVDANTGLVNDYHRWYDSAMGRWLSADPLGFLAGDGNLTRYAGNSPATYVDILGLAAKPTYTPPPVYGPLTAEQAAQAQQAQQVLNYLNGMSGQSGPDPTTPIPCIGQWPNQTQPTGLPPFSSILPPLPPTVPPPAQVVGPWIGAPGAGPTAAELEVAEEMEAAYDPQAWQEFQHALYDEMRNQAETEMEMEEIIEEANEMVVP